MKKLLIIAALVVLVASGAFAQTYSFSTFQSVFQSFASGSASALPLETSVGLNWSDAYIGQFPHFGIGLSVGAATLPYSAISSAIQNFAPGGTLPSNLSFLQSLGIPVPSYTIDVRIGGFVLPFDIGLRFGYVPPKALSAFSSTSIDYLLIGGDVRYALVKEKGIIPAISVGLGYTYMRGDVYVPGVLGNSVVIANVQANGTNYYLRLTDPSLNVFWNSNVIDAKIQVSKSLFIITPYLGLGMSYGISNAGGGMQSSMEYSTNSGLTYNPVTQTQLDDFNHAFGTNFTLQNEGFGVSSSANGFSTRVFGGLSFNLFIFKLGIGAEYEFLSGTYAGMVNARLQF
jgi:hypothetical protein